MRSFNILLTLSFLLLLACGSDAKVADEVAMEETPEMEEKVMAGTQFMERKDGIKVVEMPSTQAFPNAEINNITYTEGRFDFDVSGYEFGAQTLDADQLMCANSAKGQHIHLIIDNEPYMAKYEASFEQSIEDGDHYMLTFLSRSYHQSIKKDRAARVAKVAAKDGSFQEMKNIETPMLFYSRPKGTYTGKKATQNVMVDFYPVNAPFEAGYTVLAELDGAPLAKFADWKSYYIQGMEMGEHNLKLTLLDKEGNEVPAPFNPVDRTFTLAELPTGE